MRALGTRLLRFAALPPAIASLAACAAAGNAPAPAMLATHPSAAASTRIEEGASLDAAVFLDAGDESSGIARENDWIFQHYGRFRKKSIALASRQGRRFDVITVELSDHTERVLYFDITDFFGK